MAATSITGKHERRNLMYFAAWPASGNGTIQWEVLGVDNDDLSKELNPDVEKGKNVLGEATFRHMGYEPEVNIDPYYADTTSKLYSHLKEVAIQEMYAPSEITGFFVEVVYTSYDSATGTLSGTGYKRNAYIVPQSTGGDTGGLGIPFTVNPVGPMTTVSVSYVISTRTVTIT